MEVPLVGDCHLLISYLVSSIISSNPANKKKSIITNNKKIGEEKSEGIFTGEPANEE